MKELGPEASALLDAARWGDEPTAADEKRVLAAIGKHLAASSAVVALVDTASKPLEAATSVAAKAKASVYSAWAAKGLAAVALVGAVGVGASMAVRATHRTIRRAPMATENPAAGVTQPANARRLEALEAVGSEGPAPSTANRPDVSAPSFGPAPVHESRARGAVAAEVRMLTEAQADIQAGDAERALAILDAHSRRYPKGALVEEREAARIAALCALGRVTEAREAADRFVRATPRSPQVGSVRASCGGSIAVRPAPF